MRLTYTAVQFRIVAPASCVGPSQHAAEFVCRCHRDLAICPCHTRLPTMARNCIATDRVLALAHQTRRPSQSVENPVTSILITIDSESLTSSNDLYTGRSRRLKQVWA